MPRRIGRLIVRKDFLRVAAGRKRFAAPGLVLQALKNPTPADAGSTADGRRVGFTATKKVGNAVIRNRSKRRLRAAAAIVMTEHAAPDYDYVLIARHDTAKRDWALLLGDLENALRQMRIYKSRAA